MEIKNEHNGIKYGDKCWVWDFNESDGDGDGDECFFLGYVKGASFPVKVIDEDGHNNGFKNARTLKTEAEKVLEAFEGQKICLGEGQRRDTIPQTIDNRGRLQCLRDDGATIYLAGVHFDDWQLWEAPKVVLDTRRVAGWWCSTRDQLRGGRLVIAVDLQSGGWLRMRNATKCL